MYHALPFVTVLVESTFAVAAVVTWEHCCQQMDYVLVFERQGAFVDGDVHK
jgi:hypothetical protein